MRLWDFFFGHMTWSLKHFFKFYFSILFNHKTCIVPFCGICFIETIIISFGVSFVFLSPLSQITLHPRRSSAGSRTVSLCYQYTVNLSDMTLLTLRCIFVVFLTLKLTAVQTQAHFKRITTAIEHENSTNVLPVCFSQSVVLCEFTGCGFLCLSGYLSSPLQTVRKRGESHRVISCSVYVSDLLCSFC